MRCTSRSPLTVDPAHFIRAALVVVLVALGAASIFNIPALATGGALVWSARSPMPAAALSGAVAVGGNGRVYYFGGINSHWTTREYDPGTDTWTTVANMPTGRITLAGAAGPDGKVYAIGGWGAWGWLTNAMEVYDPATNVWVSRTPMPTARQAHAAATGTDGMIYAMGGTYYEPYIALTAVEAYNPASNSWTTVAPMPTARWLLAAVGASNGKIYAIGGYDGKTPGSLGSGRYDLAGFLNTVEEYDPATDTWTTKAPMPTRRFGLTAVATPDGKIYAIGGLYGAYYLDPSAALATVEVYDTATDTWASETPMTTPRYLPKGALANGVIYAIGGYNLGDLTVVEAATAGAADATPPTTTAGLSGDVGTNGWYRSAVQVSLDAIDSESGVDTTVYRVDGAEWVPYAGPFAISREGTTTLTFYSVDKAGNLEAPAVTVEIKIDTLPPTVTYLGNAGTYTTDQIVNITCVVADGGSGIALSTCANVSGPASGFPLGVNAFSGTATDNAGNEGTGAMSFTVQAAANPYDTVSALIQQFVTNRGIAKSLTGKLDKAQDAALRGNLSAKTGIIGAFINEVEAQTGKALTAEQAATLIRLALAL